MIRWLLSFSLLCSLLLSAATPGFAKEPTKTRLTLGVYSYFPLSKIQHCCQPLVDYLNTQLTDLQIELKPISLQDADDLLTSKGLDLVATNPAHFIRFQEHYNYHLKPLATIIHKAPENQSTQHIGGVIFTLRSRDDISDLTDLWGAWIAIAGAKDIGGYTAQAYELLQAGIALPQDAHLIETGSYRAVIESVLSGSVDAGFVPTGLLEEIRQLETLPLDSIKIINIKEHSGFPLVASTRLYPQWPVFALPHIDQDTADRIVNSLRSLPPDSEAAIAASIVGFAPASDYSSVQSILRSLELPPYDRIPSVSLADIWRDHQFAVVLILLATLTIFVLLQLLVTRNRQLHNQRLMAEDSANHFQQIIGATQAGTWKWNLITGHAVVNEQWAALIGYSLEELTPVSVDTWVDMIHPAHLQSAKLSLERHFKGETEYFEATFRMQHKNRQWVWIQSRGKVTSWAANGDPLWMFGTHMDVTERKEASLALQASQAKYERLVDSIGEKFVIFSHKGLSGELTYVSKRGVSHVFGMTKEEVLGKPWFALGQWFDEDVAKVQEYTKLRMERKADFLQFEMRFTHPSGSEHTIRVSSHPIRDTNGNILSVDGIAEDITEQKRSQERANMAATVFAHSQESIVVTNTSARIIDCNPATGILTGYSREALIGNNPSMLSSGTHSPGFYKHLWQTLISGQVWQGTFHNRHADGTSYWVETSISPIKNQTGKIVQYIAVSRDITRKKMQLEALRQAKREALAASVAKSEFVANISHEIRTPMNAILGFTDLCLESSPSTIQKKYLGNVKESARSMLRLINEILDFSKIEAGKLALEAIPFDLKNEMNMVATMAQQLINTNKVTLDLEYNTDFNAKIIGDALRLRQVLTNLAGNAVKFTNQGKIVIAVIEKHLDSKQVELEFRISDTGIGMDQEKLDSIFHPFSQADSSTTRKFGGTGLGLTISSQLIQKMGGTISVESEPGVGSTFSFSLSFPLSQEEPTVEQPFSSKHQSCTQLRNSRILLVEDNEINRQLASEVLTRNHIQVDTAGDGKEALKLLHVNTYDLVLMDIQMPVMDGYEATTTIRQQLGLVDLPIIALTASSSSTVREKCMRSGMDDYLTKPIDIHQLLEMIDKFINPARQTIDNDTTPFKRNAEKDCLPDMSGINAQEAMQRMDLSPAEYAKLLNKFADKHHKDLDTIFTLFTKKQWDEARRVSHTLKGLAATIGAADLSATMSDMEQLFKACLTSTEFAVGTSELEQLFFKANKLMSEVIQHIKKLSDQPPDALCNKEPKKVFDFPSSLQKLVLLTSEYDVSASSEIETLIAATEDDNLRSELQNVMDDLENFDFDTATRNLKKLMEQL
jgi:two-component system sensor histidine kinase/response regulator